MASVSRWFGRLFSGKEPEAPERASRNGGPAPNPVSSKSDKKSGSQAAKPKAPAASREAPEKPREPAAPLGSGPSGPGFEPAVASASKAPAASPTSDVPEIPATVSSGSLNALVDSFFDDLMTPGEEGNAASAAPEQAAPAAASEAAPPEDCALSGDDNREMFAAIAAGYVRPVRQFASRLRKGPVAKDWVEICLPAVSMVARSASAMGLDSLVPPLEAFETLLTEAGESDQSVIEGLDRDQLLEAYEVLSRALPETFTEGEGEDEKDGVVVHSLLRQVPDVGRVTLDKVFGAGLTTIEMLERANSRDLTVTTGVPARLSDRICGTVQQYSVESRTRQTYTSPEQWLGEIQPVLDALENENQAFRSAEEETDDTEVAAARRLHRRAREHAALQLDVLLAEMGQLGLVDEVQRVPFEARIARLRDFSGSLTRGCGPQQ